jgi:hypothetical protein
LQATTTILTERSSHGRFYADSFHADRVTPAATDIIFWPLPHGWPLPDQPCRGPIEATLPSLIIIAFFMRGDTQREADAALPAAASVCILAGIFL